MSALIDALRQKYKTPAAALSALGLDASLLQGRAGPGSVVGDEAPKPHEDTMKKPNRNSARAAALKASGIKIAQDATLDDLTLLLDKLEETEEPAEDAETITAPNGGAPEVKKPDPKIEAKTAKDEDPEDDMSMDDDPMTKVMAFLKGKLSDEDLAEVGKMCTAEPAMDEDDDTKEDVKAAVAEKDKKDMISKPAMDAAIDAAVAKVRAESVAVAEAREFVTPFVGKLPMALDTAEKVLRAAAIAMDAKDAKTVHASALKSVILAKAEAKARPNRETTVIAQDAATAKGFSSRYPEAAAIGRA
jgi:hypothetical protein